MECDNAIEDAIKWLANQNGDVEEEKTDSPKDIRGLYHNPVGSLQLNLQTGEVYMRKRMLMPIPTDIVAHADFKDLFGNSAGSMPYAVFELVFSSVRARSARISLSLFTYS